MIILSAFPHGTGPRFSLSEADSQESQTQGELGGSSLPDESFEAQPAIPALAASAGDRDNLG